MAKARILTTDEEIDAALEAARHAEPGPLAIAVEYVPAVHAISLSINTGQRLIVPVEELQHVGTASIEQLRSVEVLGHGDAINFSLLDVQFSIEGLLEGRRGNRRWMEELAAKRAATLKSAA